ncbi:hypothetical protein GCM10018791_66780 [Streptomyces zaomyceticus]|nr:hypothetical protein GCM10018791_66780 [Streptomyces zaomyceticus]
MPGGERAAGPDRAAARRGIALTVDLTDFRRRIGPDRVVVAKVASTEPASGGAGLPPGGLHAAAALRAGRPPEGPPPPYPTPPHPSRTGGHILCAPSCPGESIKDCEAAPPH